jgi:hypothetical protein
LLVCRGTVIAVSTSGSAPRSCHDPSRRTVAEYANPRASRRRSGPPDATRGPNRPHTRDRCYRRAKRPSRPVSSNASLNRPVNHRHLTVGSCISGETVRPECRQHAGRGQSEKGREDAPKSIDEQQFSSPELAGHRCAGAASVIHLMKTEPLDNECYPMCVARAAFALDQEACGTTQALKAGGVQGVCGLQRGALSGARVALIPWE